MDQIYTETMFKKNIYVCGSGNKSFVKYTVERGLDINRKMRMKRLFYACYSENENIITYLVELGADINI